MRHRGRAAAARLSTVVSRIARARPGVRTAVERALRRSVAPTARATFDARPSQVLATITTQRNVLERELHPQASAHATNAIPAHHALLDHLILLRCSGSTRSCERERRFLCNDRLVIAERRALEH